MAPLVSVIMPCCNAGPMLGRALRSVMAQSHPNLEIVFVDNNSTDGSADQARAIAATSPRPFRLLHCPEQGANPARILGYAQAQGDYIQWMDADDALGIDKVALQVQALEASPGTDIAYADWLLSRHEGGRRMDDPVRLDQVDDQVTRTLSGTWYPPHSYLVRRSAAERLQREQAWHPARRIGTDVEYSAIAALLSMRFRHVPGARVQYNAWSAQQTSGAATPYAARVAELRAIYLRLQQRARMPGAVPLTPKQRMLLEVDWNVWAMQAGSVQARLLSARTVQLRHAATGRSIEARPREAAIAAALMQSGARKAIPHHAQLLAATVPALAGDVPMVVATLDRFRREGLLTPADP